VRLRKALPRDRVNENLARIVTPHSDTDAVTVGLDERANHRLSVHTGRRGPNCRYDALRDPLAGFALTERYDTAVDLANGGGLPQTRFWRIGIDLCQPQWSTLRRICQESAKRHDPISSGIVACHRGFVGSPAKWIRDNSR